MNQSRICRTCWNMFFTQKARYIYSFLFPSFLYMRKTLENVFVFSFCVFIYQLLFLFIEFSFISYLYIFFLHIKKKKYPILRPIDFKKHLRIILTTGNGIFNFRFDLPYITLVTAIINILPPSNLTTNSWHNY